jgi:hypothetical protein
MKVTLSKALSVPEALRHTLDAVRRGSRPG